MIVNKDRDCGLKKYVDVIEVDNSNDNNENSNKNDNSDSSYLTYTVMMYDSFGDGWFNNVFGIKQNNNIISTFGE